MPEPAGSRSICSRRAATGILLPERLVLRPEGVGRFGHVEVAELDLLFKRAHLTRGKDDELGIIQPCFVDPAPRRRSPLPPAGTEMQISLGSREDTRRMVGGPPTVVRQGEFAQLPVQQHKPPLVAIR